MSRLILIDPSLMSTVGHHHEFAHNVLTAAAGLGLDGVLAGHVESRVSHCGAWPIRPVCRDGLWTHQAGSLPLRLLGLLGSALRRGAAPADPCRAYVEGLRDAWRSRRLDQDLQGLLEEIAVDETDLVFLPNATCTEVRAVAGLLQACPAAQRPSWHLEFHFNVFPRSAPHRPQDWRATRELQAAVRALRLSAGSTRLFLHTDTDELTRQYEALHAGPFYTLPIPVDPVYAKAASTAGTGPAVARIDPGANATRLASNEDPKSEIRNPKCLRIAYVGDARGEKGYPQLPEMIRRVWDDLAATGRAEFLIQSNCRAARSERAALAARDELAAFPSPAVRLLTEPLSTDEYRALVLESDILLLPYDPDAYEARSSGILSEALAAGKPVVVPEGTWMARQFPSGRSELERHGGAASIRGLSGDAPRSRIGVVYPPGPAGMAEAVREVVAHFEHYRATAGAYAGRWSQIHAPQKLVEQLHKCATGDASRSVLWQRAGSGT